MILRGQKVILTPVKVSDAPLFVQWYGDPAVNRFTTRKSVTHQQAKRRIREMRKQKQAYQFIVKDEQGIRIGMASLIYQSPGDRSLVVGIMIGNKKYWEKGYGSDIINTILRFGFGKLKLHRIEADVFEYNLRAITLCKKMGFKKEGVRREQILHGGSWHNVLHFGLLRKEWIQHGSDKNRNRI